MVPNQLPSTVPSEKRRINQRLVDTLTAAGVDFTVWDTTLKGFGVRVRSSGRITYFAKYRIKNRTRQVRKPSIGTHPATRASVARIEAERLIAAAQVGNDLIAERNPSADCKSISDLWTIYHDTHVTKALKQSSADACADIASRLLIPNLGNVFVDDLQPIHVDRFHKSMADTPYQANRAIALLSAMFNKAVSWGITKDRANPCASVQKFAEKKRRRYLSQRELQRVHEALNAFESLNPAMCDALRLLMFTGMRKSEVLGLAWSNVADDLSSISTDDGKNGPLHIPTNQAAQIVLARRRDCRDSQSEFVFPGKIRNIDSQSGGHLVGIQRFWEKVRRRAHVEDVRIHDLRHTFASVAVSNGISLPLIGGLLGHRNSSTTMRYVHLEQDALREASDVTGEALGDQ